MVEGAGVGIGRRPVGSRDERDVGAGGERALPHARAARDAAVLVGLDPHAHDARWGFGASPSVAIEAEGTARAGVGSRRGGHAVPSRGMRRGTSDRGRCPSARRCARGPDDAAAREEGDVGDADATRMGH